MFGLLISVKILFVVLFLLSASIHADSCGGLVSKVLTGDSFISDGYKHRIDRIKAPAINTKAGKKAKEELEKLILDKIVFGLLIKLRHDIRLRVVQQ
jgi:endonuclease YncB( thermonuclease family)